MFLFIYLFIYLFQLNLFGFILTEMKFKSTPTQMATNMMECVSNLLEVEDEVLEASARNSGADIRYG